jgi:hypothetical protein
MKKIFAMLLVLAMVLSMAACSEPSIREKLETMNNPAAPTENGGGDTAPEAPTEEAAPSGGLQSYQIDEYSSKVVTTVSFTLPESMWVVKLSSPTLYIYNAESLDVAHSASPRIQFELKENMEKVDFYMGEATELAELDSRVIGGIEMKGRTYKIWGMVWIEYYGELPSGVYMTVKISKTSVEPGTEGGAILDSVTFS